MDASTLIAQLADRARVAARTLRSATYNERKSALLLIAEEITAQSAQILAANAKDMATQPSDRLLLTAERIGAMADGVRQVAHLGDPLGVVLRESTLPNGLHLKQISVPFGVVEWFMRQGLM